MSEQSSSHKLLALARQKGMLRSSDVDGIGIPRTYLSRLTASGQLEKIGRGLYRLPDGPAFEQDSLAIVALKAPQAVFCLFSALQFHELTTQLPRQVWIALPHGSRAPRMDYPPVKLVQFSGAAYLEGIELHDHRQIGLRVYSVAKTIADCFKHRHKIGLDVALEALKDARRQKKIDADELWHYAKVCRVANVMRPYLEALE